MPKVSFQKDANQSEESAKAPSIVIQKIREAILDEVFKPGDRLGEVELAERSEVSRSPVREALLALEKEGTVAINPYKGAIVKPISGEEIRDIAELRLALIWPAIKPAYRYLSAADFETAYDLAKRITRARNPKDHFQCHSEFWDRIFSKAQRPILREVFRQLNDRMTRYEPLYFRVFPTPESRPRQQEALIELYRKGKISESFRAFKNIYLAVVDQLIGHLRREETAWKSRK